MKYSTRYPKEKTSAQYKKLPQALKEAIFSEEIAEKLYEIGRKHGLNVEKTGFLAEETGYVVLGLTRTQEFVRILSERLGVADDKARDITHDVNRQIFYPLHEALKSAHNIDVREEDFQRQKPPLRIPPHGAEKDYSSQPIQKKEEQRRPEPTHIDRAENKVPETPAVVPKAKPPTNAVDLRQSYKPRAPETSSKIPPINLRSQAAKPQPNRAQQQPQQPIRLSPQQTQPTPIAERPQQQPPSQNTIDLGQQKKQEITRRSPFQIADSKAWKDSTPKPPTPPPAPHAPEKQPQHSSAQPQPPPQTASLQSEIPPPQASPGKILEGKQGKTPEDKPPPPNIPLKEDPPPIGKTTEVKQPENKKRPYGGKDPYREPIE